MTPAFTLTLAAAESVVLSHFSCTNVSEKRPACEIRTNPSYSDLLAAALHRPNDWTRSATGWRSRSCPRSCGREQRPESSLVNNSRFAHTAGILHLVLGNRTRPPCYSEQRLVSRRGKLMTAWRNARNTRSSVAVCKVRLERGVEKRDGRKARTPAARVRASLCVFRERALSDEAAEWFALAPCVLCANQASHR